MPQQHGIAREIRIDLRQFARRFVGRSGELSGRHRLSQLELPQSMAISSSDPVLLEAFRNAEDIQRAHSAEVFGVGPMGQTAEHRRVER